MSEFCSRIVEHAAEEIRKLARNRRLCEISGQFGVAGEELPVGYCCSAQIIDQYIHEYATNNPSQKTVMIDARRGVRELGDLTSKSGILVLAQPLGGAIYLRPWPTPCPYVSVGVATAPLEMVEERFNLDLIDHAAVVDVSSQILYTGIRSCGASAASYGRIASSPVTSLKEAIVAVDLGTHGQQFDALYWHLSHLLHHIKYQRRSGTVLLDIMKVACGEYDACISLGRVIRLPSLSAAKIIVEEAGGVLECIDGLPDSRQIHQLVNNKDDSLLQKLRYRIIASGNPQLHKEIKDALL